MKPGSNQVVGAAHLYFDVSVNLVVHRHTRVAHVGQVGSLGPIGGAHPAQLADPVSLIDGTQITQEIGPTDIPGPVPAAVIVLGLNEEGSNIIDHGSKSAVWVVGDAFTKAPEGRFVPMGCGWWISPVGIPADETQLAMGRRVDIPAPTGTQHGQFDGLGIHATESGLTVEPVPLAHRWVVPVLRHLNGDADGLSLGIAPQGHPAGDIQADALAAKKRQWHREGPHAKGVDGDAVTAVPIVKLGVRIVVAAIDDARLSEGARLNPIGAEGFIPMALRSSDRLTGQVEQRVFHGNGCLGIDQHGQLARTQCTQRRDEQRDALASNRYRCPALSDDFALGGACQSGLGSVLLVDHKKPSTTISVGELECAVFNEPFGLSIDSEDFARQSNPGCLRGGGGLFGLDHLGQAEMASHGSDFEAAIE